MALPWYAVGLMALALVIVAHATQGWSGVQAAGAIALATLVSEDITLIATALAIRAGSVDGVLGLVACAVGILLGDVILFLIGRTLGSRALAWTWVQRRASGQKLRRLAAWFDEHPALAAFTSRFTPGLRLPGYLAAGALGTRPLTFLLWTALAVIMWTPLLIALIVLAGDLVLRPLQLWLGGGWFVTLLAGAILLVALRRVQTLSNRERRRSAGVSLSKIWRWEFWPSWVFYAPLLPWFVYLSIRYGGLRAATCVNPGMPHGGLVGESKSDILSRIAGPGVLQHLLLPGGSAETRLQMLSDWMAQRNLTWPIVLKPNAGQRGAAVRVIASDAHAMQYLMDHPQPTLAQEYHPGPHEVGVLYFRFPDQAAGHVFSLTDKRFPEVIGDGRSTLTQLIWADARLRMQADRFLARLGSQSQRVPASGERVALARAGNHSQGTEFLRGEHLRSPELEQAIDRIAQRWPEFSFGRFDVRYADLQELRLGRGLAVVELNGLTSESTDIYDPRNSLIWAYRRLARQWALAFAIGAVHRQRGAQPASWARIWADARRFYDERSCDMLAD